MRNWDFFEVKSSAKLGPIVDLVRNIGLDPIVNTSSCLTASLFISTGAHGERENIGLRLIHKRCSGFG